MRPRRLAPAAALLAALALALGACSGGEPPPAAATPEATPTAEAPSTPAPTAIATPEAAPTPEPPPEAACANGVAVAEPEARPGLVSDCVALLASRDALRGEASLDWSGDLAIERWEGVAVGGEPPRVTGLDLRDRGLTGAIPRTLRRLRLDEVRLAGNVLRGCVPSAFGDARGDAAYLGLPWCLRYDRLDATGEVAEAGGWAILDAGGEVLATWEGLRSEAATLRVHQTDAGGTSWASEFGAVSEGDLFEWRKASDCWVRYHVTGPPVRPAAGSGRWEFPVEWMTYAATGEGCKGVVGAATVLRADESAPTTVSTAEIASPVRYGPYLLAPRGWEGEIEQPVRHASGGGASGAGAWPEGSSFVYTQNLAEARRAIPLWRDPVLPADWTFSRAEAGTVNSPYIGYCAVYHEENGYFGATICVRIPSYLPKYAPVLVADGSEAFAVYTIDGHVARVRYSPKGPAYDRLLTIVVQIFNANTGIEYEVAGHDPSLKGNNVDSVIAIARSLLPADAAP